MGLGRFTYFWTFQQRKHTLAPIHFLTLSICLSCCLAHSLTCLRSQCVCVCLLSTHFMFTYIYIFWQLLNLSFRHTNCYYNYNLLFAPPPPPKKTLPEKHIQSHYIIRFLCTLHAAPPDPLTLTFLFAYLSLCSWRERVFFSLSLSPPISK